MANARFTQKATSFTLVLLFVGLLAAGQGCARHQRTPGLTPAKQLVFKRDMTKCRLPDGVMTETAAVYTVFLSRGHAGPGAAVKPELFTTNDELLDTLKTACPGVNFIATDLTKRGTSPALVVKQLQERKQELDGVLLVGVGSGGERSRDYSLAFTGLPTIAVYNLFEFMNFPYKLFATGHDEESVTVGGPDYTGGRVLTAELDRMSLCDPSVSSAMFQDLVYKIKLIQAIQRLKHSRLLIVGAGVGVDYQGDAHKRMPKDYNKVYAQALKDSLGVTLVTASPEEFFEAYEKTDVQEAEKTSEKWIRQAKRVEAARSEITKTARAYLAFEALRKKYNCNAVSTFMRTLNKKGDRFWPGLGLECGFKTTGIQAVCQNYPNILVTQLLGYFLTGRPSMLGDLIIDPANRVAVLTHCGAPVNPYGDKRIVDYVITTHAQSPLRNTLKPGSSTGLRVEWPTGEPVTFWKMYVLHKKIGFHAGAVVSARSVYDHDRIDNILCRTKLLARVQGVRNIQKHSSPDEYGIHRAATLGDLSQVIKDVAVLLGYTAVQENR